MSTTEERSQDKIKEIVEMYRSGDYNVRVPEIPELECDFLDVMAKLDRILASADPQVIQTIRSHVRMEYRTYIYGWKPVELPAVPETPSGLYDFIAAKSTPYEVPLVNRAVQVLNVDTLTEVFKAYKSKLADRLRVKLQEMLLQFEQLQTSKVNEDAMKYEHLQNEAIALKMKLKVEEILRKKAEEEQRRIAGELVKMEKKLSESGSKSSAIHKKAISDVESLLGQSSESVEGLKDKIRILVEEWSKISEHEPETTSLSAGQLHQIEDLKEEMLHQFEQLQTSQNEQIQHKAISLELKIKEEEIMRKNAVEEKRKIAEELVKMQKKLSESTSRLHTVPMKLISDIKSLLGQSSDSVEGLQDKIRILVEESSKISEHEDLSQSNKRLRIKDLEEEMLLQFERLKTFEENMDEFERLKETQGKEREQMKELKDQLKKNDESLQAEIEKCSSLEWEMKKLHEEKKLLEIQMQNLHQEKNRSDKDFRELRKAFEQNEVEQGELNQKVEKAEEARREAVEEANKLKEEVKHLQELLGKERAEKREKDSEIQQLQDRLAKEIKSREELEQEILPFKQIEEEEIRDSRVYDVSIDAHSSPYAIVFKEGAKSLYLTTYLMLKNNAEETTYRIYVTYYSPTWSKLLQQIVKAAYKKAIEFKAGELFQFANPPSGKLVCEVEETMGNGWAVAIDGSPEIWQTEVSYEECAFTTAKLLEGAVKEGLYPPYLTLTVVNNVSREENPTPKYVNCTIRGADRPLRFSINVWERRRDPSSPKSPTPSLYNNKPSDAALNGILRISPDWTSWIIDLGVPIDKAVTFESKPMGGLLALQYWRDGKSGEHFPPTWKFLLDTMNEVKGCEVADKIVKRVEQNEASWCVS